jgi:hypothetical protein
MDAPIPQSKVFCTQCGGELHPDQDQLFLTCPYCSSTVYLDKSQVVFHWYLAPTLDETRARASLARWMSGNETVKDLDQKSQVEGVSFEYFPVWYFKRRSAQGKEEIALKPAAATSVSEIRRIPLLAGDLRKYESAIEAQSIMPTVPLEAALNWAAAQRLPRNEIAEKALVHLPLYTFKYSYLGQPYTAIVEAGTGRVFANIFPAKAEAPYRMVGGLAAAVFLCLATFPVIGALIDSGQGIWIGLLACSGLGILAAPALFALAAWVAAKV